jgi:hypothetical protein
MADMKEKPDLSEYGQSPFYRLQYIERNGEGVEDRERYMLLLEPVMGGRLNDTINATMELANKTGEPILLSFNEIIAKVFPLAESNLSESGGWAARQFEWLRSYFNDGYLFGI